MKKLLLTAAISGALLAPALASAQTWSNSAPSLTVSATVAQIRQFKGGSNVDLGFGSDGVEPGVTKTVAPEAASATTGTGAKVDIRFNTGTKVTVTGSALTATVNATTYTITPTYSCAVATDQTGTGKVNFAGTCAAGHEFLNSTISGMTERSVLVGASIPGTETSTKPAATYTGTITVALSASSS